MADSPTTPAPAPPAGATAAKPRRRVPLWKKLALLAGSVVIAALLVEACVLIFVGEQAKFPRHVVGAPWGLRYNEPGSHYRHKSADVTVYFTINHQGMRAPRDYPYAKPAGVKRIVSLGDSFTIGYEVDMDKTFSATLERELNAAGVKAEVLNCGVSGYSTAEACLYLERELVKYEPDAVLVSFFPNDLVDNIRTGLFRMEDGRLVGGEGNYVPGGGFGDFVNTNWLCSLLSERSNAFVLVKERLTSMVKQRLVDENRRNLGAAETTPAAPAQPAVTADTETLAQQKMCAAIYERIYADCRARNIPLIIQSIPWRAQDGSERLLDLFPVELFDTMRPGIVYVPAKPDLDPFVGKEKLYWTRSHWHWTPFCHDRSGKLLAKAIIDAKALN